MAYPDTSAAAMHMDVDSSEVFMLSAMEKSISSDAKQGII